jgi:2-desacetyl-2-hydroxyethyl bacteriochlorophyllide A dehydrogenase
MSFMKAIVIEQYGGKEQLKELEVKKPIINENQVLIEMHATSVNPIDWKIRQGYLKDVMPFQFPIILGWDAAGVIVEKGDKVEGFKLGDRVFARPQTTANGTYTEYIATEENLLAKIPDNISFEEAASIPLTALTAWQCLVDLGKLKSGQKVLIHAGAGGVGSMAIQIAKSLGAFVATTGSGKNEEFLISLGADKVINYEKQAFEKELKDYDLVIDTMGGEIQNKSYSILKKGGKLVTIVNQPAQKLAENFGVTAIFHMLVPNGEQLRHLAKLMEAETIRPIVGHVFEFSANGLQAAHALSETHHSKGKIIIKIK